MRASVLGVLLLLQLTSAVAGQQCTEKKPTLDSMHRALSLATRVQERLDVQAPEAAILARVGSDVSAYGLRYTHAALVYRRDGSQPWTVVHKLNDCGADTAKIYTQGLGNFFLDDPFEYRALILFPRPELARKLVEQLRRDQGLSVHEPRYSLLAYPFGLEYQNSNQWLLEYLAVADSSGTALGRKAAIKRLKQTGYEPDEIPVGPLERVGASLFKANVAFFDHPLGERLSGHYSVVTVESLVRYLQTVGQVRAVEEIALPR